MSNTLQFNRSPLDLKVAELSDAERLQILIEGDAFERTGVTGDTFLREKAREYMNELTLGNGKGFDASWILFTVHACHKYNSIQAIEATMKLDDDKPAEPEM